MEIMVVEGKEKKPTVAAYERGSGSWSINARAETKNRRSPNMAVTRPKMVSKIMDQFTGLESTKIDG